MQGQKSGDKNGGVVIETETSDPLNVIKDILSKFRPIDTKGLPRFSGGLVGYIGYDVVKFFERVPDNPKPEIDMPDIFLMLADTVLIFDNLRQTTKVVYNTHTEGKDIKAAYEDAKERIDKIIDELMQWTYSSAPIARGLSPLAPTENFSSNFTKENFLNAVEKAKEYVMSGDVVQVVLSQRFERQTSASAFDIYRSLRIINPSPYMYYLDTGESQIVGSSPEILVRLEDEKITLRPIAGTRKRGGPKKRIKPLKKT